MAWVFLSHELSQSTPTYGNDPLKFESTPIKCMSAGDSCTTSLWKFPNHLGTHVDAPAHFSENGLTIDRFSAAEWVFEKVGLVHCENMERFLKEAISLPRDIDLLIWRSDFEQCRGTDQYVLEQPTFSSQLIEVIDSFPELRGFGFDRISLSSMLDRALGRELHRELLKRRGLLLFEDMKLSALQSTPRRVVACPIRVKDADGAPCTILAEIGDSSV